MTNTRQLNPTVKLLNEALSLDPSSISSIFGYKVSCNEGISDHPLIQVSSDPNSDKSDLVTALGLINGILLANNLPMIMMTLSENTDGVSNKIISFSEYQKSDTTTDK